MKTSTALVLKLVTTCSALFLFFSNVAFATEMQNTWMKCNNAHQAIEVWVCISTFPDTWNQDAIKQAVRDSLETWNTQSNGADFRFVYGGERDIASCSNGCSGGDSCLPDPGQIAVRYKSGSDSNEHAHWITKNNDESVNGCPDDGTTRSAVIGLRGIVNNNEAVTWVFKPNESGQYVTGHLNHAFGRILGLSLEDTSVPSVVDGDGSSSHSRMLWHPDITALTNSSGTYHYSKITTREIERKRSTDNGDSWNGQGGISEYTNSKIGVTYNPSETAGRRYMVAWTSTTSSRPINTVMASATSVDATTKITHSVYSDHAPALAYGNGTYLLVWTTTGDSRAIQYKTSSNGTTWSSTTTLPTSTTYGSLGEPAVAWNQSAGAFVIVWTTWYDNDGNFTGLSKLRSCVDYTNDSEGFKNCQEYNIYSFTPPSVDCRGANNDCLVAWAELEPWNEHRIINQKASISSTTGLYFTGTRYTDSTVRSRIGYDIDWGNGVWLNGFWANNETHLGAFVRMSSFPTWDNDAVPEYLIQVSPTVEYGSQEDEILYFYINQ